jgi:hypothetical protein
MIRRIISVRLAFENFLHGRAIHQTFFSAAPVSVFLRAMNQNFALRILPVRVRILNFG